MSALLSIINASIGYPAPGSAEYQDPRAWSNGPAGEAAANGETASPRPA
jgi:hypothetical protein